jgi:hypothetical protein
MPTRKAPNLKQHETLRVPAGWKEQDRMLIVQLERIFDDIYNRLGNIRYQDLSNDLKARLPSNENSP